jgi:uncharacterized metal-binding protein YceD (DUF177 family)
MASLVDSKINLRQLSKAGRWFDLVATESECHELQTRLNVRTVNKVEAKYRVDPLGARAGLQVSGTITADVVQACIVTLEDVPEQITEEFAVRLINEVYAENQREQDLDPEDGDFEHYSGEFIDMSEVLTQYVSLALNPYPRVNTVSKDEEIVYSSGSGADNEADEKPHPFAELKKLQDKT